MAIERRRLSRDPLTGDITYFHYDHADDSITIERVGDLEPFLESNKRAFNDADSGWKGDTHWVCDIPPIIVQDLIKQGILAGPTKIADEKRFAAWMNDRDTRSFRRKPGRV